KNTMYLTKFSFGPTDVPRWQRDNFPQTEYGDFDFIRRNVPDISASAYVIFGSPQTVRYGAETISGVDITPVSNEIYEIENIKIEEGRFYTESESINGAPVIVLGHSIAENLFGKSNPIGKQIRVYGRKLTVIGVIKKMGGGLGGGPDDKGFVPANFVRRFQTGGIGGIPGAII